MPWVILKTNYVGKGVPVIIGEFGANNRVGVISRSNYDRHHKGRLEYYDSFMKDCYKNKVASIAWDTGYEGDNNMTIIRRQSEPDGSVFDIEVLNLMRHAYRLGDYVNMPTTRIVESPKALFYGLLTRQGQWIYAQRTKANIQLFDLHGNLIRESKATGAENSLEILDVHAESYIAKRDNQTLFVLIK